jgi:hypothetical protein
MTAFGDFLKVDELRIRFLCPAPRLVDLVRENAYRHRDVDAFGGEVIEQVLPISRGFAAMGISRT